MREFLAGEEEQGHVCPSPVCWLREGGHGTLGGAGDATSRRPVSSRRPGFRGTLSSATAECAHDDDRLLHSGSGIHSPGGHMARAEGQSMTPWSPHRSLCGVGVLKTSQVPSGGMWKVGSGPGGPAQAKEYHSNTGKMPLGPRPLAELEQNWTEQEWNGTPKS